MPESSFSVWHGIQRKDINWHPTIDESKCVGCGLCVVTCSEKRNVFGFDPENKKAVVLYPDNCMVGCDNCRIACLWDAISFPEIGQLKQLADLLVEQGTIENELKRKLEADSSLIVS
ncbi:MAG: ferredoxin family protein [Nitrososphaeria archaeon]